MAAQEGNDTGINDLHNPTQGSSNRHKNTVELVLWVFSQFPVLPRHWQIPNSCKSELYCSSHPRRFVETKGAGFAESLSATAQNFSATVGDSLCYWPVFLKLVNTGTFQRTWSELGHMEWFSGHLSEGLGCRSSSQRSQHQGEHKCPLHPPAARTRPQLLPGPGTRAEAGLEWSHSC